MLLDDGGDLTAVMHKDYKDLLKSVKGLSEETTTGIKALKKMEAEKKLLVRNALCRLPCSLTVSSKSETTGVSA